MDIGDCGRTSAQKTRCKKRRNRAFGRNLSRLSDESGDLQGGETYA
jgi:hypothetical protein